MSARNELVITRSDESDEVFAVCSGVLLSEQRDGDGDSSVF